MKTLWNKLITNESGLILSAELVLILTIGGGNKSFVAGSSFIDIYDGGAGVQGSSMAPVTTSLGAVSEINTGVGCPIVTTPSNACLPAAPMPQPQGVGSPCEVCPPGTEVVPCPITVPTVPSQR